MNGILDFLKTPAGQGLLAAGLGAASSYGRGRGLVGNLGTGGLMGLQAYTGAQEQAKTAEVRDMQIANYKAENDAKRKLLEDEARKRAVAPTLFGQSTPGAVSTPEVGGIPMFSAGSTVAAPSAQSGGLDWRRALQAGFTPEEIQKMAGLPDIGRPKATRQMEVDDGKGGKRIALVDDFGREVAGFAGYAAPVQVNQGDRVSFVRPTPGVSLPVGMSPSERDASSRGWASLNETKRHNTVTEGSAHAGRAPQGYRFRQDGSLEAIPGGPADKQSAATADERKAATLLQRLEGSQRQLDTAVRGDPGAAKPELFAQGLRALGAETLANTATSTARQRVDNAQLDMLDAALTLATGAAYTKEQLEGHRKSYFPQVGDDPETVKDKQDRLANVVQAARIAAGRAANLTTSGQPAQPKQPMTAGFSGDAIAAELARRRGMK